MLIRPATPPDLPAITEIYNDAVLTTTATFDIEPRNSDQQLRWFEDHGADYPLLVAEMEGRVVGWASLSRFAERVAYSITAETSVYVDAEHRGQGIGRELLGALIDEGRGRPFHSLVARIAEGGEASIRLHERFGFEVVGTLKEVGRKFDRLLDVSLLQLLL
jgi:L-amino acid N-acyltransferase